MKPFSKAWRLGICTAAFLLYPVVSTADPIGETPKPDRSMEAESMLQGAPNQDATLRDRNANAGAPIEGADPGMVKAPPKANEKIVERPPISNPDPGIHVPGNSPTGSPVIPK